MGSEDDDEAGSSGTAEAVLSRCQASARRARAPAFPSCRRFSSWRGLKRQCRAWLDQRYVGVGPNAGGAVGNDCGACSPSPIAQDLLVKDDRDDERLVTQDGGSGSRMTIHKCARATKRISRVDSAETNLPFFIG